MAEIFKKEKITQKWSRLEKKFILYCIKKKFNLLLSLTFLTLLSIID